jgi:PAS domain S-box-containing protein
LDVYVNDFADIAGQDYLEYLEQLTDHMFDGIVIEKSGIVIYCNRAFEEIAQRHKEEVIGKSVFQLFMLLGMADHIDYSSFEEKEFKLGSRQIQFKHFLIEADSDMLTQALIFRNVSVKTISDEFSNDLQDILEILGDVYGHAYHGMVIVDREGRIIKWDYEELLGYREEEVLGKYAQDVIENTRMHIVVKTGKKEIFQLQKVNGRYLLTSRIPIFKNGKLIGAVGTTFFKNADEMRIVVGKIDTLENTVNKYKREISHFFQAKYCFKDIITKDAAMLSLIDVAKKASKSSSTILIQGESGTGKEFFAHSIHNESNRCFGPFVSINCAAIPRDLLEAELFGYEEGAFTGARKHGKLGKFELANGGCLLLDEIGSMPIEMQAKLLRVLETREFERVGSTSRIELDARIIVATNEELDIQVKQGKFRQDLYYRLNVIKLKIPPLRDRIDDIPLLAANILKNMSNDLLIGKRCLVAPGTLHILKQHDWPGNVRELRNVIERAVNLSQGEEITPNYLPDYLLEKVEGFKEDIEEYDSLRYAVIKAEREAILRVMNKYGNNKSAAAKALGIHRTSLYKKMELYHLDFDIEAVETELQ